MSKEKCVNKKLHPYCKTGIYGWLGEEVDDNDYIFCPICGEMLGINYWDYSAENNGDNKCPECGQELDYSEFYDFEDTCYFEQLVDIKDIKIKDLEHRLANCIEPKFKIGQEVWFIYSASIGKGSIKILYYEGNKIKYYLTDCWDLLARWEDELFATKEEAKKKLREMQNGK